MDLQVQAIGIPWYLESDYETLLALFTDGHKLPRSFLQWQDKAEQLRKRCVREGKIVVKAYIDPATFPAWCAARGCNVDAGSRMDFANTEAVRVLREADQH